jgi:hypothetical protein
MPRDDDYDDRPRSRRPGFDQAEEDYSDEPLRRRPGKQISVLGVCSLVLGVGALGLSLIPCLGAVAVVFGLPGFVLGMLGYVLAKRSYGRQGTGLPISGIVTSAVAILISLVWIGFIAYTTYEAEQGAKQVQAQMAREESEREAERATAAAEVRAAAAGGAIQVTAAQFYKAFDDDEDRFNARFKNKVIELSGTMDEVSFVGDTYTLMFKTGADRETVDCEFAKDPDVRDRLARLKPGDRVTVRGKCLGGGPDLEACVIVE